MCSEHGYTNRRLGARLCGNGELMNQTAPTVASGTGIQSYSPETHSVVSDVVVDHSVSIERIRILPSTAIGLVRSGI